jgi:hypothetical protein
METGLLLFIIVLGNLSLYWLFFGKKRLEQKIMKSFEEQKEDSEEVIKSGRETPRY